MLIHERPIKLRVGFRVMRELSYTSELVTLHSKGVSVTVFTSLCTGVILWHRNTLGRWARTGMERSSDTVRDVSCNDTGQEMGGQRPGQAVLTSQRPTRPVILTPSGQSVTGRLWKDTWNIRSQNPSETIENRKGRQEVSQGSDMQLGGAFWIGTCTFQTSKYRGKTQVLV